MSRSPLRDLVVGLFVLAGIVAVAWLSFVVGGVQLDGGDGLVLHAKFDELGGLKTRAPVDISGVKVGQVSDITLGDDYRAVVTLRLDPRLKIPSDTTASIVTAGVLGDRYVLLQPGGDPQMLASGAEIAFTESAVLLERLIGKIVHNVGDGSAGRGEAEKTTGGTAE